MEGEPGPEEATLFPATVGEKLRSAREAQGLDISEVASRTRIPQRHLEAIERSNYTSLPSATYALGFAKAYARAIGADEIAIGRDLRRELDHNYERVPSPAPYQMEDPTRTPSRGLVWIGLIVALLVAAGAGAWYSGLFRPGALTADSLDIPEETPSPSPSPTAAASPTGGQVTLVARDTVWLRVTDATGKQLFQAEMKPGDRYDVPQDADHPKAKTGRADQLQVLINGSEVPPLGPPQRSVEAEVSAAALQARGATPAPGATPSPGATSLGATSPVAASTPAPRARPTAQPVRPATSAPSMPVPAPTPTLQTPAAGGGQGPGGEHQIYRFVSEYCEGDCSVSSLIQGV
ncbi:MAG: DUF4115 domain-containing protein [Novosphingobium sp.]|nr:DUF4115 domain-containing protein [Novosphingobium sp.]